MKVMVLGCGPAGLFAAHAANELDADVMIWSRKRRSEMFGAQNLLQPIPGLTDEQNGFKVSYSLKGSWEDYRAKVYGEGMVYGENEATQGEYAAWDIREAYYRAWKLYSDDIKHCYSPINPDEMARLLRTYTPDVVISTIPAPVICRNQHGHSFAGQDIWAVGDAPERGIFAPAAVVSDNTIEYDGTPDRGWHRAAVIAGYATMEWPGGAKPPVEDVHLITKPIATNCDCWMNPHGAKGTVSATPVLKVGRFGAWSRLKHAHHAYYETLEMLQAMRSNRSLFRRAFGGAL